MEKCLDVLCRREWRVLRYILEHQGMQDPPKVDLKILKHQINQTMCWGYYFSYRTHKFVTPRNIDPRNTMLWNRGWFYMILALTELQPLCTSRVAIPTSPSVSIELPSLLESGNSLQNSRFIPQVPTQRSAIWASIPFWLEIEGMDRAVLYLGTTKVTKSL